MYNHGDQSDLALISAWASSGKGIKILSYHIPQLDLHSTPNQHPFYVDLIGIHYVFFVLMCNKGNFCSLYAWKILLPKNNVSMVATGGCRKLISHIIHRKKAF